jgi:hypothetical protein
MSGSAGDDACSARTTWAETSKHKTLTANAAVRTSVILMACLLSGTLPASGESLTIDYPIKRRPESYVLRDMCDIQWNM